MRLLTIFLLSVSLAFGTISATTNWDVRTTGADTNGGGFDTSSTGTDRSQQDTAFLAYTDIVIGATTTQATSAAHPFDSTSPGNVVNVISGTGCTVQRAQVVSVSGVTATFDVALGTAASTCTANLGGALATVVAIKAVAVNFNPIYVRGTFTQTVNVVLSNSVLVIGYTTTHGDGGYATFTTATNSIALFTVNNPYASFQHLKFTNTAVTRGDAVTTLNTNSTPIVFDCSFDGFHIALNSYSGGGAGGLYVANSEIKNSTNDAIEVWFQASVQGVWIHNNTGMGINRVNNAGTTHVSDSIINNNGSDGIGFTGSNISDTYIDHSVLANNTGSGVNTNAGLRVHASNSIFYGNGAWGINTTTDNSTVGVVYLLNNAFGANTSGTVGNTASTIPGAISTGQITLTANPFTSATNFALNGTAGGGALLKGAGFPGVFPGGLSTGAFDVGAVQSAGTTASQRASASVQ
jgi:hypothetical protein